MNIHLFGSGASKVEAKNKRGLMPDGQSRHLQKDSEKVAQGIAPMSFITGKVLNWLGEIGMGLIKLGSRFEHFASKDLGQDLHHQ